MLPLDWVWIVAGLIMQSMVICAMLRGWFRKYPLVFAYLLFSFFSTVVQVSLVYHLGRHSREYIRVYWFTDFVGTFLVLMVIIHWIRIALTGHPNQKAVCGAPIGRGSYRGGQRFPDANLFPPLGAGPLDDGGEPGLVLQRGPAERCSGGYP